MSDETIVLTGDGINFFKIAQLKARLRLEIQGLRASKGPTAYSQLRKAGFKGSRTDILGQISLLVETHKLGGIEIPESFWPPARKLEKLGLVTLSEPRGPAQGWIRVTLTDKRI